MTKYDNPASTVDMIVNYEGGIVLIKRKYEPFKDYWALPGGFLDCGKETLEKAVIRELYEETNLKTNIFDLKLVGVYSDPNRDPRGHIISHVYEVKKYCGELEAKDDAKEIKVFKKIPSKLAFDHEKILNNYFKNKKLEKLK